MKIQEIESFEPYTKAEVAVMYANLIVDWQMLKVTDDEVIHKVNQRILLKWKNSGLISIKENAWRIVKSISKQRP